MRAHRSGVQSNDQHSADDPAASQVEGERGAATVLVLAVALVGGLLLLGLGLIAGTQGGRVTAQTAADLAALAGADAAAAGGVRDPCSVAAEVAQRNRADLAACSVTAQGIVEVETTRTAGFGSITTGQASARARAGPAWLRDVELSGQVGPG